MSDFKRLNHTQTIMDMSVIVINEGVSDLLGWGWGLLEAPNDIYGFRNMG